MVEHNPSPNIVILIDSTSAMKFLYSTGRFSRLGQSSDALNNLAASLKQSSANWARRNCHWYLSTYADFFIIPIIRVFHNARWFRFYLTQFIETLWFTEGLISIILLSLILSRLWIYRVLPDFHKFWKYQTINCFRIFFILYKPESRLSTNSLHFIIICISNSAVV